MREWATLRRGGRSISAIADDTGISPAMVRSQTAAHGPFRPIGHRLPHGLVGLAAVARITGLNPATVRRWRESGRLPPPDFVTAAGRWLWLEATLTRWEQALDLDQCPTCGARCASLSRHRAANGH